MKKSILMLSFAALTAASAFASRSTEPAVADAPWVRSWWMPRFDEKKELASKGGYNVVFIGDSITHYWESKGKEAWDANYAEGDYRALNLGFSGDRTEHVLWRLKHGILDGTNPKAIVLMIGSNNTGHRKAEDETVLDTFLGIRSVIEDLDTRFPEAVKVICPIFPRGATTNVPERVRNDLVNQALYRYVVPERIVKCKDTRITWCDVNRALVDPNGVLSRETMPDLLHPAAIGYRVWVKALQPHLDYALGKGPAPKTPRSATAMKTMVDEVSKPATCRANPKNYWLSGMRKVSSKGKVNLKSLHPRMYEKRDEIQASKDKWYDVLMVGDSITHFWEQNFGQEAAYVSLTNRFKVLNVGFGGFHTEDVIWTTYYGGMADGFQCQAISLMIGTNNRDDSIEDVVAGLKATIAALKAKQPFAKIVLTSILPWKQTEDGKKYNAKNVQVNARAKELADGKDVFYLDLYDKFLNADGSTNETLFKDNVHPSEAGYKVWVEALTPVLDKIVKKR